jgi:hypothetical protein
MLASIRSNHASPENGSMTSIGVVVYPVPGRGLHWRANARLAHCNEPEIMSPNDSNAFETASDILLPIIYQHQTKSDYNKLGVRGIRYELKTALSAGCRRTIGLYDCVECTPF